MKSKILLAFSLALYPTAFIVAADEPPKSSYAPVVGKETFAETSCEAVAVQPSAFVAVTE